MIEISGPFYCYKGEILTKPEIIFVKDHPKILIYKTEKNSRLKIRILFNSKKLVAYENEKKSY
jgi:hypothetical protein